MLVADTLTEKPLLEGKKGWTPIVVAHLECLKDGADELTRILLVKGVKLLVGVVLVQESQVLNLLVRCLHTRCAPVMVVRVTSKG